MFLRHSPTAGRQVAWSGESRGRRRVVGGKRRVKSREQPPHAGTDRNNRVVTRSFFSRLFPPRFFFAVRVPPRPLALFFVSAKWFSSVTRRSPTPWRLFSRVVPFAQAPCVPIPETIIFHGLHFSRISETTRPPEERPTVYGPLEDRFSNVSPVETGLREVPMIFRDVVSRNDSKTK